MILILAALAGVHAQALSTSYGWCFLCLKCDFYEDVLMRNGEGNERFQILLTAHLPFGLEGSDIHYARRRLEECPNVRSTFTRDVRR